MNLRHLFRRRAPSGLAGKGLDLGTIKSKGEAEIELLHPVTGEGLGAYVTLAGPEHPARRRAQREVASLHAGTDPAATEAHDGIDQTAVAYIGRIMLGWREFRDAGRPLEFSAAAALDLCGRHELQWMVAQLLEEAARQENFIETSARS